MPDPDQPPDVQALQTLPPKDRTFVMSPAYIVPDGNGGWKTQAIPDATGFYAVVTSLTDEGKVWNGTELETFDANHWATYAIAATRIGASDRFEFEVPFSEIPEGVYTIDQYAQTGASPLPSNKRAGRPDFVKSWNSIDPAQFVEVNHDYGGTDVLRLTKADGTGIGGASVRAYRRKDWISFGVVADSIISTRTKTDGRWHTTLPLLSGQDYAIVFYTSPRFKPEAVLINIPAETEGA